MRLLAKFRAGASWRSNDVEVGLEICQVQLLRSPVDKRLQTLSQQCPNNSLKPLEFFVVFFFSFCFVKDSALDRAKYRSHQASGPKRSMIPAEQPGRAESSERDPDPIKSRQSRLGSWLNDSTAARTLFV